MTPPLAPFDRLPLAVRQAVDDACTRAEAGLRAGVRPDLTALVRACPAPGRAVLLVELIGLDLEYRRGADAPTVADYLALFPDDRPLVARAFEGFAAGRDTPAGDAAPDATHPFEPPAPVPGLPTIPGYVVEAELGRGGMAVVYRAFDVRLRRPVAVKVIHAPGMPDAAARFRQEAALAAGLHHPNILPVYATGEADGADYLVLELVSGGTLANRLAAGPLPPAEAAGVAATLAGAVEYAHRHGVVHRDLKPANVLRTADGDYKVADFGLAKSRDHDPGLTATGLVLGTPTYMAPEQARADAAAVGPAADVWGLGVILYECLTGRPPFRGATAQDTILSVLDDDPVPPSRLARGTPRDLDAVCLKCLEKTPARRYPTAAALADDLNRFLAGKPTAARPLGVARRVARWVRRRPTAAGLVALLAAFPAAVALAVGFALYSRETERGRDAAEQARDDLAASGRKLEAALRDVGAARDRLDESGKNLQAALREAEAARAAVTDADAVSRTGLAYRDWLRFRPGAARDALHGVPPDRRGWDWALVAGLCRDDDRPPDDHQKEVWTVAVSADGSRVVSADHSGRVVVRTAAGTPVRVAQYKQPVWAVALSPDGAALAVGLRDHGVKVVATDSGKALADLPHPGQVVNAVAFGPDGAALVTAGGLYGRNIADTGRKHQPGVNAVRVWDWRAGRVGATWDGHANGVLAVAFDAAGKRVASGSFGLVAVWDVATGRAVRIPQPDFVRAVGFGAGNTVLVGTIAPHVGLYDAATGRLIGHLPHGSSVHAVAPTADGRRVVTGSKDNSVRVWDLASRTELRAFRGHDGDVTAVGVATSGVIVSGGLDRAVRVWDIGHDQAADRTPTNTRPERLAVDHAGARVFVGTIGGDVQAWRAADRKREWHAKNAVTSVQALAVRPDDREVAVGGADGKVARLDAGTGEVTGQIATGRGVVTGVAYLADGAHIVTAHPTNGLAVWDAATGALVRTLPGRVACDPSADGRALATFVGLDDAAVIDAETGAPRVQVSLQGGHSRLGLSDDGRRLAVVRPGHGVAVYDLAAPKQPAFADRSFSGTVMRPHFTGDGKRLVLTGDAGVVRVLDAPTGRESLLLQTDGLNVHAFAMSVNGSVMVAAVAGGELRWWRTGMPPPRLHAAAGATGVGWAGGAVVAGFAGGTAQAWDATTGEAVPPPTPLPALARMAVGADGRYRADLLAGRVRVAALAPAESRQP